MEAHYSNWVARWQSALAACERMGGKTKPLIIAPPARADELALIEGLMGLSLPLSFRTVMLEFSPHVEFFWTLADLPRDVRPPDEIRKVSHGYFSWNLFLMTRFQNHMREWVETFPDADNPYDRIWHNKLGFSHAPNDDFLAFDLGASNDPPVIYCSHDDGAGHGYRLGDNFVDFMDRWTLLGCPGNEDWPMMPFLNDPMSGLDPDGENAKKWRQWFGLNV